MDEIVLAADLGGTNLRMAAVGADGAILSRAKRETPRSDDAREIVTAFVSAARECLEGLPGGKVKAMGVAIPAMSIDPEGGIVKKAANLPSLNGFALAPAIEQQLGFRVLLENDANAAALGESWTGASRGVADSICVTLGTGVGGGIILDGTIRRGPDWSAGEVGHICVEPEGHPCGCGSHGCVEQYTSATAISRMAVEIASENTDSVLAGNPSPSAFEVYNAGKKGDAAALEVFRRMGSYLGLALSGLINTLNPEVIVLGGGAAEAWDLYIDHLRTEIGIRAYTEPAKRVRILRAMLGDDAGIIGAARLAFNADQIPLYRTV